MPPVGFEPTVSAGERQQTYALDRAATGTGTLRQIKHKNCLQKAYNDGHAFYMSGLISYTHLHGSPGKTSAFETSAATTNTASHTWGL